MRKEARFMTLYLYMTKKKILLLTIENVVSYTADQALTENDGSIVAAVPGGAAQDS